MGFTNYLLESYDVNDTTVLENLIMNYDAINACTLSTPVIMKEIKDLNETAKTINNSELNMVLDKYKGDLTKELESRIHGSKAKLSACIECVVDNSQLSNYDMAIFESLDIYPDSIENDIKRIDKLIESYMGKISSAGMMITHILPAVVSIAKYDETLLTENMCHIGKLIADKITEENVCENIVEYYTILKESYNGLYFDYMSRKNEEGKSTENTHLILKETFQLCNELDEYIKESLSDINNVNHFNSLCGKIRESVYELSVPRELPISDNVEMESVVHLGRYLEILEESINKVKDSGANSKEWERNHKIEKKTREFYDKTRQKSDAKDRNKAPLKKGVENVQKALVYPLEKLIKLDKKERRERLIEGGFRHSIFRAIRKIILSGALYLLGGSVFAVVGFLGSLLTDTALDAKTRKDIVHEFDTELKVIEEKIQDAKAAGKRREKYQLMRLQDKMERERNKVKYGTPYRNAGEMQ